MKAYILKVIGAAMLASVSEFAVPKEWKKYMRLVTGFILISVLMLPLTRKIPDTDFFSQFEMTSDLKADGEQALYKNIKEQFESDIAEDITKRISDEFGKNIKAKVEVKTTSDGKIEKVERIELFSKRDEEIEKRMKFVYGTDEIIWT